ncbi:exodeoxyribonuclease III [Candidatus Woesearchaeota archaeon]|jgi:exodeoxyribonuclease III|nr:exodeoxyribonuclease III [Candidatus Woesearchaeota archaeon]
MKIISWNVNGIRAVLKKGFVDFVDNSKPDILCLQETKAHPDQVDKLLDDYEHHYWNSADKKGYSGTAVFSKIKPLKVRYGGGLAEGETEGRVITLEYDKFYLVNVYTPNSQRGLTRLTYRKKWDKAFLKYLKELDKPVILCGDLNVAHKEIDLARPKNNVKNAGFTPEERSGFDNYLNSGFVDTFRMFTTEGEHYSFWSYMFNARKKNIGWRIDYFCVSEKLKAKVKSSRILKMVMGSDHAPVEIKIDI